MSATSTAPPSSCMMRIFSASSFAMSRSLLPNAGSVPPLSALLLPRATPMSPAVSVERLLSAALNWLRTWLSSLLSATSPASM